MTNSKKRVVVSIISLGLLFIMIIGISYAYYAADVKGNTSENPSLKLTSGFLAITYTDGKTEINDGNTSTDSNDLTFTKEFEVANSGVQQAYYGVLIDNYKVTTTNENGETIATEFVRPQDWTYELKAGNVVISSGPLPTSDATLLTARGLSKLVTDEDGKREKLTLTVTYNYISIEDAEEMGISLNDADQTADAGKTLTFDVIVTQSLSVFNEAEEGTLLYSLGNDNIITTEDNADNKIFTSEVTVPGQDSSTESILSSGAEDDYGTSYYFRGNVTNNYVTYSGMCWRIVRIQGDGTIKLALADTNNPCGTANGYSTTDGYSAFIADDEGNAEYVTYTARVNYTSTDLLFENSNIQSKLNEWAVKKGLATMDSNENLIFKDELTETEWCQDTSVTSVTLNENNEYAQINYGGSKRLGSEGTGPSLKCNQIGININGTVTTATRYKNVLGILSADEVAFAGSTFSNYNNGITYNYYLMTNANDYHWTMTPYEMSNADDSLPYVFDTVGSGGIVTGGMVYMSEDFARPSVVLRSDVKLDPTITGQNGTVDAPYVVLTTTE